MPLPKQIQDQQALSEEFDRQVKEAQNPPETPPAPESQPEPAPQPAPAPPAPPPAVTPDWEQKYRSLQGMFNSTVPQLQQQLREVQAELARVKEAPKQPETPPKPQGKLVTDADVQAFGGDLIDVIRRGAQEQIEALQQKHNEELAALRTELAKATQGVSQVAEVQTKSVRDQFFTTLESKVPQWEQIQGTAECQNWLGTRVPGTQYTWNDALVSAAERFDVEAVTEVFGEFFDRHPALKPGAKPAAPPPPRNRDELNRQVTPPRSHANAPLPNADKRQYTGQEYEIESMKIVRLAQQGKTKEAAALEAELNAALAEGRVRP